MVVCTSINRFASKLVSTGYVSTRKDLLVHLIHTELHAAGFVVSDGQMGENITTSGIDLLGLLTGTRLLLGKTAVVEVTGLRNPCHQLDRFQMVTL